MNACMQGGWCRNSDMNITALLAAYLCALLSNVCTTVPPDTLATVCMASAYLVSMQIGGAIYPLAPASSNSLPVMMYLTCGGCSSCSSALEVFPYTPYLLAAAPSNLSSNPVVLVPSPPFRAFLPIKVFLPPLPEFRLNRACSSRVNAFFTGAILLSMTPPRYRVRGMRLTPSPTCIHTTNLLNIQASNGCSHIHLMHHANACLSDMPPLVQRQRRYNILHCMILMHSTP